MTTLLLVGEQLAENSETLRLVEREGFVPVAVPTAEEALKLTKESVPAVVLIQHRLPDGDGVELLKTMRERHPSVEAVLVTPGGEIEPAIEVLRAGALDYLYSPIDLQQLQVALGRAKERRRANPATTQPVVLVLEDHELSRESLAKILRKEGYVVLCAPDGVEGMEIFKKTRVDVILLDLSMPRMGGLEVLGKTKGAGADVEVLVMTGYGDEQTVVQALRNGAINFLRKPIDIDQMLIALEKAREFQVARRSLLYRNRDVELMQQLVLRLTQELELIVETQGQFSDSAVGFLHRFLNALPLGLMVVDERRAVVYANRSVSEVIELDHVLDTESLHRLGVRSLTDEVFDAAFSRAIQAQPGSIETITASASDRVVLTALKVVSHLGESRYVAVVVQGASRPDSSA